MDGWMDVIINTNNVFCFCTQCKLMKHFNWEPTVAPLDHQLHKAEGFSQYVMQYSSSHAQNHLNLNNQWLYQLNHGLLLLLKAPMSLPLHLVQHSDLKMGFLLLQKVFLCLCRWPKVQWLHSGCWYHKYEDYLWHGIATAPLIQSENGKCRLPVGCAQVTLHSHTCFYRPHARATWRQSRIT